MRTNLYIAGLGLLIAGASATTLIASGNQPGTRAENTFEILAVNPADGASVKQISSVTVTLNSMFGELTYYNNEANVTKVSLTKEGGEPIYATGFGEMTMNEMTWNYENPILFPAITEAGTYTLNIPEGVFAEGEWDDNWNIVPVSGGMVNAAFTSTIIVDPNAASVMESYILTPASGSSVGNLDNISVEFPEVPFMGFQSSEDDAVITATCGDVVYEGYSMQDWSVENYDWPTMRLAFLDESGDYAEFTPGKWEIHIGEGAFVYNGEPSPEINAEYTIIAPGEPMETSFVFPADNSTVKELGAIKLYYRVSDPEAAINVDESKMDFLEITKDGRWFWRATEIGEPSMEMNDSYLMIPVLFSQPIDAGGEYAITIPEGLFYQTKYNEETDEFDIFEGYRQNAEQVLTFTVDPEAAGVLEEYTLNPAADATVSTLSNLSLTFDNVPTYIALNKAGIGDITLVNGDTEYIGMAEVKGIYSQNAFNISFYDESGEEAVIGAGEYKLTIPEGYFSLDGQKNPEITSIYTVAPSVLTPASGSTITTIEFKLEFPSAKTAEFVGAPYMITFGTNMAGIPSFNVEKVADAAVPTFLLTPMEGATANLGYNILTISEGAFLLDGSADDKEGNSPLISAVYTYEKEVSHEYIPEPNLPNNEVVAQSWGYTIGFVFDEGVSPSLRNGDGLEVKFGDTVLTRGSEDACYEGLADYSYNVMDNILSFFIINPDYRKEGQITVTLKGDAYTLSGQPGFDITHTWNVVLPKEYDVVLAPMGSESDQTPVKVGGFDDMTLTFNDAEKVEVLRVKGISLNKTDYSIFASAKCVEVEEAEVPTFKLVFETDKPVEYTEGLYRLQIYFDTFAVDDVMTWPADYNTIELYYYLDPTLSGVDSINAALAGKVTVVTTDGKVILNNQPASRLNELEKGLYIINGKKALLK